MPDPTDWEAAFSLPGHVWMQAGEVRASWLQVDGFLGAYQRGPAHGELVLHLGLGRSMNYTPQLWPEIHTHRSLARLGLALNTQVGGWTLVNTWATEYASQADFENYELPPVQLHVGLAIGYQSKSNFP